MPILRSCTYPVINLWYFGKGERLKREKSLILIVLSQLLGFSVMVQDLSIPCPTVPRFLIALQVYRQLINHNAASRNY